MKKFILACVLAIGAILPASVLAQEDTKEYNMVITLQNGTTITLGHNDIKNITFNGEEISIAGNALNSIVSNSNEINELWIQLNQTSEMINSVLNTVKEDYASSAELEEVYKQLAESKDMISQVYNVMKDEYATNEELEQAYKQIEESKEMLSQLYYVTDDKINAAIEEVYMAIQGDSGLQAQMTQIYNAVMAQIEELKADVEKLKGSSETAE